MLVTISGKGGVGKTSVTTILLDELARHGFGRRVLVVDGDPAGTLPLALGLPEPPATLAQVRDATRLDARTVRGLPPGTSPAGYVLGQLQAAGVLARRRLRAMPLDVLAMGQGEGPGCYCSINGALATVLEHILARYALVLVDNEAGLEHLSRYRIRRVDLFLVLTTPGGAAWSVAQRILETARRAGMELAETGILVNRVSASSGVHAYRNGLSIALPESRELAALDLGGLPAVQMPDGSPLRAALHPLVDKLMAARPGEG